MVKLEKVGDEWTVYVQRRTGLVPVYWSSEKSKAEHVYEQIKDQETIV